MGRYEFKIKRNTFRNRARSSRSRFDVFEDHYAQRRKGAGRNRIILMVAIILLTIILLFTFNRLAGNEANSSAYPEFNIEISTKTL